MEKGDVVLSCSSIVGPSKNKFGGITVSVASDMVMIGPARTLFEFGREMVVTKVILDSSMSSSPQVIVICQC